MEAAILKARSKQFLLVWAGTHMLIGYRKVCSCLELLGRK
jgi:hypothetical protein